MVPRERIPIRIIQTDRLADVGTPDYENLASSLAEQGQLTPIVILQDGTLVDGRRRLAWLEGRGETKVDASVVSTLEDAVDALAENHPVPPDRIRRIWEIRQTLTPLITERDWKLRHRPRPNRRVYREGDTPVEGLRELLRRALGDYTAFDKVMSIYNVALSGNKKAADLVESMEKGELTIHQAFAQHEARRTSVSVHFARNVVTAREQKQLLTNAVEKLSAIVMAMQKLGPIKMSTEDIQPILEELRRDRGLMYRTVKLLEEAGRQNG